jgi:DDE family transposase
MKRLKNHRFMSTRRNMMSSLAQEEEQLKVLFNERANSLARQTGFVQRQRKLSGADFVQGLVFGWLHQPQASLGELAGAVAYREVSISESGLAQRFTEQAAAFMQAMLAAVVEQVLASDPVPIPVLERFQAVIIEDSSQISLPDELQKQWRGCGGNQQHTKAAIKLHVRWDLATGRLQGPLLSDGRLADQRSPLRSQGIPAGALYITDEGYFGLKWLKEQSEAGGFFLTRPRYNTAFFDQQGHRLDLPEIGPKAVHQGLDLPVLVGTQVRLPARLVMVRVPEEVAEQRREQIRETARKHGRQANERQLALTQWTILITNAPGERLALAEVLVLARARWQIERLFRLWKEDGQIDEWRSKKPWRILCEIYSKLIAQVVQHWCLLLSWQQPDRSLVKAAKVVRSHALQFIEVLMGESSLEQLLRKLHRGMARCRLNRRAKHPNLSQLLLEGLDWPLT